MNKYLKLIGIFVGIWFISSLMNGILSSVVFGLFENNAEVVAFVIPLSFIFSIPFVGLSLIIAMIACSNGEDGERIYKIVLHSSFFIGCGGAIFFVAVINYWFNAPFIAIPIGIVVSAVSTIIIFRNKLKSIE